MQALCFNPNEITSFFCTNLRLIDKTLGWQIPSGDGVE